MATLLAVGGVSPRPFSRVRTSALHLTLARDFYSDVISAAVYTAAQPASQGRSPPQFPDFLPLFKCWLCMSAIRQRPLDYVQRRKV